MDSFNKTLLEKLDAAGVDVKDIEMPTIMTDCIDLVKAEKNENKSGN